MGRYSRGRRGGPAKAVGRETGARVRIPLFPPSILLTYQMPFGAFFIIKLFDFQFTKCDFYSKIVL